MSNMTFEEVEKMQRRFSDIEVRFIREQGLISADEELERFGVIESKLDDEGDGYKWFNHLKALERKVEVLEELMKLKADDYKWEATTTKKLVKK